MSEPAPDSGDTWPPADAPYRAELIRGNARLSPAVRVAFEQYLAAVKSAVLDHDTSVVRAASGEVIMVISTPPIHPATATGRGADDDADDDAGDVALDVDPEDLGPDLDAWPPRSVWDEIIAEVVVPASQYVWHEGWLTQLSSAQIDVIDDAVYLAAHLADTTVRLTNATWPDAVYERVRAAVAESVRLDETPDELRTRIAESLSIDVWSDQARVVARNELHAALSTGAYQAGLARQDTFDEQLWKQWLATDDDRTRPDHRRANGAVAEAAEAFLVGGEHLQYPHDPTGSPGQTIQCRCAVNWLDESEVDKARDDYARYLADLDRAEDAAEAEQAEQADPERSPAVTRGLTNAAVAAAAAGKRRTPGNRPHPARTAASSGVGVAPDGSAVINFDGPDDEEDDEPEDKPDDKPADDKPDDEKWPPEDDEDDEAKQAAITSGYWSGPLLAIDHITGDSSFIPRMIGSMDTYQSTNHPWLSYQRGAQPAHYGKVAVGRPEVLWVANAELDGEQVLHLWGAGSFDLRDPDVPEVARKLVDGFAGTVSADLDSAQADLRWFDDNGKEVDEPDDDEFWDWLAGEDIGKRPVEYYHTWRFAGVTMVQDPAFHTGWIRLSTAPPAELAQQQKPVWQLDFSSIGPLTAALTAAAHGGKVTAEPGSKAWCEQVAAGVPFEPPASHFTDPKLAGPTKVTVGSDRRVFGHIADWETLHAVHDIPPPRCQYGGTYPKFHRHPVTCSDGTTVLTGPLSTGGHASEDPSVTFADAMAHYDDPHYVLADVVAGEDQFGIWVSGSLRPGVSAAQVLFAYRYSFSGDWRDEALIAACSCSVPAFHLAHDDTVVAMLASAGADRPKLANARTRVRRHRDGSMAVLVASGIVRPTRAGTGGVLEMRGRRNGKNTLRANTIARRRNLLDMSDGHALLRALRAAQDEDSRLIAARRRVHRPAGEQLAAAAARIRKDTNDGV